MLFLTLIALFLASEILLVRLCDRQRLSPLASVLGIIATAVLFTVVILLATWWEGQP